MFKTFIFKVHTILLKITFFITKAVLWIIALAIVLGFATHLYLKYNTTPSNIGNWSTDQAILPEVIWDANRSTVLIRNIRNFTYTSTSSYATNYYDRNIRIRDIKKVSYIVEPFQGLKGSAHTFLSFEYVDQYDQSPQFIAVSVEIRKEKGESFSPVLGLFNKYEIMYVVADERDVIKLRTNYRKDDVYLYPIKADEAKVQELFTNILNRVESLSSKPEFYNTISNNCTTNIAAHVNAISPKRLNWNYGYILPAYSDKFVYDQGLIDTTLPFEQARAKFKINEKAIRYADDPSFSLRIRE